MAHNEVTKGYASGQPVVTLGHSNRGASADGPAVPTGDTGRDGPWWNHVSRPCRKAPPYSTFAFIYDKAMGEAVLPSVIDAFDESLRAHRFGTGILADVGCGTGRFLRYLARYGGRLFGVDRSPAMLRRAVRRLSGNKATLLRQDMRQLVLPEPVETLTCTFDTINYLVTAEDLHRAFAAFARALLPGGTLLFDFIPQGACRGRTGGRQWVRTGPVSSEWRISIDPVGQGSVVEILMWRHGLADAPCFREVHRQRWHSPQEIRAAMRAAGLTELDWRPAEPGNADWVHVVARRSAGAP